MKLFIKREYLEDLTEALTIHQETKAELARQKSLEKATLDSIAFMRGRIASEGKQAAALAASASADSKQSEYYQARANENLERVVKLEAEIATSEKLLESLPKKIKDVEFELGLERKALEDFVALEVQDIKL